MLQGQIPDPGGLEPDAANGGGVAGDGGAVGAEDAPMPDVGGSKEVDRDVAEGGENAKGRPIRQARSLGKAHSRKFVAHHSLLPPAYILTALSRVVKLSMAEGRRPTRLTFLHTVG
jgi:hypothetical protein